MRIRRENVSILFMLVMLAGAAPRDGATIVNSGSTNTAPYTISLWSDGTGTTQVGNASPAPFTVSAEIAQHFFADLDAARTNGAPQGHCMRSASFGTRTIVQWHGWSSPDLQCPPFTPQVSALAQDVTTIENAANIKAGSAMHRIQMPVEMRKIPTATPEVQPT